MTNFPPCIIYKLHSWYIKLVRHSQQAQNWVDFMIFSISLITVLTCTKHPLKIKCKLDNQKQSMRKLAHWGQMTHIFVSDPSSVQIIDCHLIGAKSLSEPMLASCSLTSLVCKIAISSQPHSVNASKEVYSTYLECFPSNATCLVHIPITIHSDIPELIVPPFIRFCMLFPHEV